jgi:hypothetical protein
MCAKHQSIGSKECSALANRRKGVLLSRGLVKETEWSTNLKKI